LLFEIIKGKDEKDATSVIFPEKKEYTFEKRKLKLGVPKIKADEKILELIKDKVKEISNKEKWKTEEIKLKYIDLGVQTYYPINYVEFFSSTRRYDGRKYGKKIEESCGDEVLRRILGGKEIAQAEYAGKYYRKALQAKRLIEKEFDSALKKFDCLILPTVPKLPHKLGEKISVEDMYNYDSLTVLANLSGVPALSLPVGKIQGIPIGMQIICGKFQEKRMFYIAKKFETLQNL